MSAWDMKPTEQLYPLRMKTCVLNPPLKHQVTKNPLCLCVLVVKGFTAKMIHSILNKYSLVRGKFAVITDDSEDRRNRPAIESQP
jgi:hypothetical protein